MPAMFPESAEVEPHWFIATPRGVVTLTLTQLEDALLQGHVGTATLVTRAGMPTWYTLGVLTGFVDRRAHVAEQPDEVCVVATRDAELPRFRDERSWLSSVLLGAGACVLLLVILAGLEAGPRSTRGYKALVVAASESVARTVSNAGERLREIAGQIRRR
jgi:hypothetical protein